MTGIDTVLFWHDNSEIESCYVSLNFRLAPRGGVTRTNYNKFVRL